MMEIFLSFRFCWYRRFLSAVRKTSYDPSIKAKSRPFFSPPHPFSGTVTTKWPGKRLFNFRGIFSSRMTLFTGELPKFQRVLSRNCWEVLQKLLKRAAPGNIVQEGLCGNACSHKNQRPAQNLGIRMHGAMIKNHHKVYLPRHVDGDKFYWGIWNDGRRPTRERRGSAHRKKDGRDASP
jgi:hypothetical protein